MKTSRRILVGAVALVGLAACMTSCKKPGGGPGDSAGVSVKGVTVSPASLELAVGGSSRLTCTITPSDATDKGVTWSSAKESVASVDQGGNVTGVGAGSTTITVRTEDGGKTATCSVTVKANVVPVTEIKLDKSELSLQVGGTGKLTVTVLPSDATDRNVSYSSSDEKVATVSPDGTVTAVGVGKATITVSSSDGKVKATCSVTVTAKEVAVTGVTLDKSELELMVGDTYQLTPTITPADAMNKNVKWSTNLSGVASVAQDGTVTAKKAGAAKITCTTEDGGFKATCQVTVTKKEQKINGHEYVEMGDGLKWATMNVGASKPEDYGDYFAWGETAAKSDYSWSTYKHIKTPSGIEVAVADLWKYISKYTFADGQTSCSWYNSDGSFIGDGKTDFKDYNYADDAARQNWKSTWRTPTDAEWTALRNTDKFDWTWTADYEGTRVAGRIVTSKVKGYEGNSIFLPAAGYRVGTSISNGGSYGYYWSSSLNERYSDDARYVFFFSGEVGRGGSRRYFGWTVRPVSD